jgi:predicted MFS family arabinose efflux permease
MSPDTNARPAAPSFSRGPLYWMALGAFAVGAEGFMIAAILPKISSDLSVSIAKAGQLVAVFALAYALSSPILTTLTGSLNRRKLLIGSMAAFAVANLVAAVAPNYWALVGARVLLAFAAGLYVPSANALAGALAAPERRAGAIATVNGGITMAIALGVPLGAVVGNRFGWRMTFVGVSLLAATAVIGLIRGLPHNVGAGMSAATLKERVDVIRLPNIPAALFVTTLWALGTYAVYTFIAPFLAVSTGVSGSRVGYFLFVWGASAGLGLFIGGSMSDKVGPGTVIGLALPTLAFALLGLSGVAHVLSPSLALVPVVVLMSVWATSAWSFYPAQQARLIGITGLKVAPIILSLNASFMYLGFSLGASVGAFAMLRTSAINLGWIGGSCELLAFALFSLIRHRRAVALDSALKA